MRLVHCPHCRASQEVEASGPGPWARHVCSTCGKPFAVESPPSPGTTQRLPDPETSTPRNPPSSGPGSPEIPSRMGAYEIRRVLGEGGMGVVYEGYDANLGRRVAVKTLKPDLARDREFRERFLREARAAAALSHPNVTQIYFIGEEGGRPFFVMEFLEGKSLEALLRQEGKLPPDRAVEMLRQAASGLRAAASRGIVHRDIKPSNLVLASDGVVKVTDFGLAKSAVADEGLTLAGEVLGSPNYMSPEQASGQSADLRSDIYSLGATLYELVTGRPPFDGPTAVSIILKHAREPLRNPRQIRPDLPYPLVTLIQKMMAKRPQDRPQSYDLLLKELERLGAWMKSGGEGVRVPAAAANAAPTNLRAAESSPRSPAFWVLVPVLVLAALGGWGLLRQLRAAPRAPFSTSPSPAAPAQPPTIPPATEILSSSSEVTPPNLAPSTGRRLGIDLPPRLERLREAARANLQFVTNSHEFTPDGRLRVLGTVLNTGLARAIDIRIRISLSSSSGQILGTTEVPLVPSLLEQQQTGSFEALFPDPRQPISIRTELNWNS